MDALNLAWTEWQAMNNVKEDALPRNMVPIDALQRQAQGNDAADGRLTQTGTIAHALDGLDMTDSPNAFRAKSARMEGALQHHLPHA
jgi:hypothetical protein